MASHSLFKAVSRPLLVLALMGGLGAAGYVARNSWLPLLQHAATTAPSLTPVASRSAAVRSETLLLSDQAIENLRLNAKPARPQTYWKTIQVPGMVVDLPGRSDRGVVTPVTGVDPQWRVDAVNSRRTSSIVVPVGAFVRTTCFLGD